MAHILRPRGLSPCEGTGVAGLLLGQVVWSADCPLIESIASSTRLRSVVDVVGGWTWVTAMGLALRGLVLLGLLAASYQRSRPTHYENSFATGDELELRVYLSSQLRFYDFNNSAALIWHATGLRYDMSSAGNIETTVQVNVTEHMLNNGSMYCHSFFTKAGKSPDPKALGSYDRWSSTHTVMSMIAHGERLKPIGLYNLLTGEPAPWEAALRRAADEAAAAGEPEGQFIPYWKPKMHLQLVVDTVPFPLNAMPNMIHNALHQSGLMHGHRYRPFVYVNELTVMRNHWVAVNASSPSVPLEVSAKPLSLNNPNPNPHPHPHPNPNPNPNPNQVSAKPLKAEHFQWMVNLKHSFAMQEEQLGISEKESEELRGMLVHTNPNPNLTLTLTLTLTLIRNVRAHQPGAALHHGAHAHMHAHVATTPAMPLPPCTRTSPRTSAHARARGHAPQAATPPPLPRHHPCHAPASRWPSPPCPEP